jgi:hypothetical protein
MSTRRKINYENTSLRELVWRGESSTAGADVSGQINGLESFFAWLTEQAAIAWYACGAFEWVALGYLGLSSVLVILFAQNLSHPWRLLGVQAVVALGIMLLCRISSIYPATEASQIFSTERFWYFWRHWYPHLFFLFCFEELGALVHLISPQWQDSKLITFDRWLTGVNPILWLDQFATPARNDFMQFAYLTYFIYLLTLGAILYYRREWHAYWSVMTYSAVAYAIGYVIAIFFPIESPWFSMADLWHSDLQGGPFTATIGLIEHFGRVRGAAFPSEHVAGSVAALLGAWRHRRWLFWLMLPLVLCMWVSTIWGRYHYVADVFGGMVTGTIGYWIGRRIMNRDGALARLASL